jgi:hypothetical protein
MSMKEDNFADWYLDIVEKANLSRNVTMKRTTKS